jgi:hypothetical protein
MERKPRARYDEFADQFTSIMYEHWSDILQIINRQSPRVAALLRVATPSGLKRVNGPGYQALGTFRSETEITPRDSEFRTLIT